MQDINIVSTFFNISQVNYFLIIFYKLMINKSIIIALTVGLDIDKNCVLHFASNVDIFGFNIFS